MGFLHPVKNKMLTAVIRTSPRSRTSLRTKPQLPNWKPTPHGLTATTSFSTFPANVHIWRSSPPGAKYGYKLRVGLWTHFTSQSRYPISSFLKTILNRWVTIDRRLGQTISRPTTATWETNYLKRLQPTVYYTGLFIRPSGISELDCATTKRDTAERSISIGRESLQVFFCTGGLGVLPGSTARG